MIKRYGAWCKSEDVAEIEEKNERMQRILIASIGDYKWFVETINNLLKRIDGNFI